MARHEIKYVVEDEGRDKGKVFLLTEMDADKAEAWAMRAVLALINSGIDLPEGFESMGMAGLAEIGMKAFSKLKWDDAKPLMDEMFECVKIIPDPSNSRITRDLIESDTEEIKTRLKLRVAVWKLHTGFSNAGAR